MNRSLTLREYLASQSPEFQAEVEQGAKELIQQIEALQATREVIETTQTDEPDPSDRETATKKLGIDSFRIAEPKAGKP